MLFLPFDLEQERRNQPDTSRRHGSDLDIPLAPPPRPCSSFLLLVLACVTTRRLQPARPATLVIRAHIPDIAAHTLRSWRLSPLGAVDGIARTRRVPSHRSFPPVYPLAARRPFSPGVFPSRRTTFLLGVYPAAHRLFFVRTYPAAVYLPFSLVFLRGAPPWSPGVCSPCPHRHDLRCGF